MSLEGFWTVVLLVTLVMCAETLTRRSQMHSRFLANSCKLYPYRVQLATLYSMLIATLSAWQYRCDTGIIADVMY